MLCSCTLKFRAPMVVFFNLDMPCVNYWSIVWLATLATQRIFCTFYSTMLRHTSRAFTRTTTRGAVSAACFIVKSLHNLLLGATVTIY